MNRLIFPLIAFVLLLAGSGCSEKINVAAPYKDITVVYSFLDNWDTAHYVRIQKAFLDNNKSSLDMAKTYDSSFYKHLNVTIKRLDFAYNLKDTIHLDLVNLDNEGYPKEAGVFFNTPNFAYKFKGALNPSYIYRLVITNLLTGRVDSADAPIIDDTQFSRFYVDALDSSQHPMMDFSSTAKDETFSVRGNYVAPLGFKYLFAGSEFNNPVSIAQAIIRFRWSDSDITTTVKTPHYYDYDAGFRTAVNGVFDIEIQNVALYNALATGMKKAPANQARLLDRVEIFVYMSTPDFATYRERSLIQGTGLTGNEIQPVYTNIQGEALGLFTSKGWRNGLITMTSVTVDSLKAHALFAESNIKGTLYH